MTGGDLPAQTVAEVQALLRRREISPPEVLQALRARIAAIDSGIGAYLSFDDDAGAAEAARADVNLPLGGANVVRDCREVEVLASARGDRARADSGESGRRPTRVNQGVDNDRFAAAERPPPISAVLLRVVIDRLDELV